MKDPKELVLEHFKNVLDAYSNLISKEKGSQEEKDWLKRFYELVNYEI